MIEEGKIPGAERTETICFKPLDIIRLTPVNLAWPHDFYAQFHQFLAERVLILLHLLNYLCWHSPIGNTGGLVTRLEQIISGVCSLVNVPNNNRPDWIKLRRTNYSCHK